MTSSAKKKRERKKDFQKPKLKVGKAKPKAVNHTDTNFRAKAIVLNQQLSVDAPSASAQFSHHVSLLSSKSENQRRESLVFLAACLDSAKTTAALPLTISAFLEKLCPLILDGSNGVRSQLLKLFQTIPPADIKDRVARLLPHIRAGWRSADAGRWTASKASIGDNKLTTKAVLVLAEFLKTGLLEEAGNENVGVMVIQFPTWHLHFHQIPSKSNAYRYLNIFGPPPDDKNQMLEDREDRLRCYNTFFATLVNDGITISRKEGGELGRAAGILVKVLQQVEQQVSAPV
ncbi:hypothetical protein DV736_g2537, partial [Chaetothyriales sp. CBS 134916]